MRLVDRFCDGCDAGVLARADVRARMRDQPRDAKRLASLDLIDEPGDRFFAQPFVGRAEVDEVGIVRDDAFDLAFAHVAPERSNLLLGVRLGFPLARGFGENLDAVASDRGAARDRFCDPARDRHMRAEQRPQG